MPVPWIVQISTLVVKYRIRTSSTYFNNTLSGEARNVCMRLNIKPIIFIQYLLKMCKLKCSNSSNESTKTRQNFCHYLNVTLNDKFTSFWKDQVLQNGDISKLKEYKKLKVNVGQRLDSRQQSIMGIEHQIPRVASLTIDCRGVNISLIKPKWKLLNDKNARLRYFVKKACYFCIVAILIMTCVLLYQVYLFKIAWDVLSF
jgi:hypothetical protein